MRSKLTALFIFKGENYFLPNCGKTESFPAVNNQSATVYIRPYELTLSRESHNALASGTIRHINAIGFIVRIEVESSQTEQPIEVILTKENYLNAQYKIGDHVYLVPDKLNLFQGMNI